MKSTPLSKLAGALLATLTVLFLGGCYALSLHPFYAESNLLTEPTLTGEWIGDKSSKDSWQFEKSKDEGKGYLLTIVDGEKKMLGVAHLFKLRNQIFLDVLTGGEWKEDVFPPAVPTHTVFRVDKTGVTLQLRLWNYEWLSKYLEENPKALAHEMVSSVGGKDPFPVLTAKTADLQKFLIEHLDDKKAWGDEIKLQLKK